MTGMVLAAKYNQDMYYDNPYYSLVGGVAPAELNRLEIEMLSLLDFDLHVSSETYDRCLLRLVQYKSGSHTYPACWESADEGECSKMGRISSSDSIKTVPSLGDMEHHP